MDAATKTALLAKLDSAESPPDLVAAGPPGSLPGWAVILIQVLRAILDNIPLAPGPTPPTP